MQKRYTQTECPSCDSSDAFTIYEDGSHCFSCNYSTKKKVKEMNDFKDLTTQSSSNMLAEIQDLNSFAITSRGISKQVIDYFGIKMSINPDGSGGSHYYPYTRDGKVTAYKERVLPKSFQIHGDYRDTELFGQSSASGGKTLVITEGELDACAVAQSFVDKYNKIFPVVSIPSATGIKVILEQRDWIRTFESIILLFDNDEAGKAAIEKASKIIGAGKVKVGKLKEKDPCEQLLKHGSESLLRAYWDAQTWSPAGLIVGEKIWDQYKQRKNTQSIPYPECLSGLNEKLKGIRHGEITLFTSGTGSGKSTVIKEIVLDLMGCKYLVLDHITIAVSEGSEGLSGNEAIDKIMSDLLKIVKKHNVWLGLISHLRKAPGGGKSFEEGNLASIDDIKGSGSIKQISFDIISFARNLVSENLTERNTIKFRVLKSRFTGLTGSAGSASYDNKTGRLNYISSDFTSI